MSDPPDQLRFHYIKSNHFRVVHVDGVIGGPTPRGTLQLALYSERSPIPTQIDHRIDPDGTLGAEVEGTRLGKDGLVREVEVEAIVDVATAHALYEWLGAQLGVLEKTRASK